MAKCQRVLGLGRTFVGIPWSDDSLSAGPLVLVISLAFVVLHQLRIHDRVVKDDGRHQDL